jgi:ribosomal protein S18 acetylase RimI-like enzyme
MLFDFGHRLSWPRHCGHGLPHFTLQKRFMRQAKPLANPVIEYVNPQSSEELAALRGIFLEYANTLKIDLCFQDFDRELASLPGEYAQPRGYLLAAVVDGSLAGCCALRALDSADYPNACEMKRLFVRPTFRGLGLGRDLVERILDAAREAGYHSVLLDTLDEMETARALYHDLGFEEIPPYYHNPIAGAHYLKAEL